MAAFTAPAKKWDVFISYARVAEPRWVEGFIAKLQEHLDRELHQNDAAAIFWDRRDIAEAAGLTPEIVQSLDSCATMVLVMSHAYRDRPWCRKECSHFARLCGESSRRIFVVTIENVSFEDQPPEVVRGELLPFPFWEASPESVKRGITRPLPLEGPLFDTRIRELARSLATRLRELKTDALVPAASAPLRDCTLFLADGETGHPLVKQLESDRMTVRTSFTELGATVYPQTAGALYELFYNDRAASQAEAERLIGESTLFLQLLGKKWDTERYEAWLVERALAVGKRFDRDLFLWRPRSLDHQSIADVQHREFVGSDRVIANELINELIPLLRRKALAIEADKKLPASTRDQPVGGGNRLRGAA